MLNRQSDEKEPKTGKVIEEEPNENPNEESSKNIDPVVLVKQILNLGIYGFGPLSSAKKLGDKYINNPQYSTKKERIEAMQGWEEKKNFGSGFLTSLGGLLTLPLSVPLALALNWILQTRMSAAIAHIAGYEIEEPPIKMAIVLSLLGKNGKEMLNTSIQNLDQLLQKDLPMGNVSKKFMMEIYLSIGKALLARSAEKGLVRLSKAIPAIGGVIGGILDYQSSRETSEFAKELFQIEKLHQEEENHGT